MPPMNDTAIDIPGGGKLFFQGRGAKAAAEEGAVEAEEGAGDADRVWVSD